MESTVLKEELVFKKCGSLFEAITLPSIEQKPAAEKIAKGKVEKKVIKSAAAAPKKDAKAATTAAATKKETKAAPASSLMQDKLKSLLLKEIKKREKCHALSDFILKITFF